MDNKIVIRSLAQTEDASQNTIQRIELLGHEGELKFTQTSEGLTIELTGDEKPDLTCALRITGNNLKPVLLPTR
jgi:hypothetical protein